MSHLFATAGAKLYIGGVKAFNGADLIVSDFSGQTWTLISGTTNLGSTGDTSELLDSGHTDSGRVRKAKGLRNAGALQVIADLDYADAGQLAVVAAEKEDGTFAFRLVFNDAPAGGTPSERLFVALVQSATEELNEANNVMKLNATLEIDSNIVRVIAAA